MSSLLMQSVVSARVSLRDQIAVDLPHPECEASIFSSIQPLVLSTRLQQEFVRAARRIVQGAEQERWAGKKAGKEEQELSLAAHRERTAKNRTCRQKERQQRQGKAGLLQVGTCLR